MDDDDLEGCMNGSINLEQRWSSQGHDVSIVPAQLAQFDVEVDAKAKPDFLWGEETNAWMFCFKMFVSYPVLILCYNVVLFYVKAMK